MMPFLDYPKKKKRTRYYDRTESNYQIFGQSLKRMTEQSLKKEQTLLLVCIGTDRITGDCLGPLVGHKLSRISPHPERIFGTLKEPVHAQNLKQVLSNINKEYTNPFLIVIDASLGIKDHIGYITLSDGPLRPGEGVQKRLPPVGEISITGIVNCCSGNGTCLLQNTRLHLVEELADYIFMGIISGLFHLMI
ncbi:MAG: spore protease YyaC [Lachnospiraceae bacterium]|nr:spore protease YyaC [Lachnospiraceae bacterium]